MVTSRDSTTIAFDKSGEGLTIILVDGALQYRAFDQGMAQLADLLAQHFTVFHYDRRGRGDSTDTPPYALEREIEDIEALIDEAGGSAFLFGISSGAALRAARVAVPALVMDGSESFPFMHKTAVALANAIPNAQHCTLEGQTHEVAAEALAPVLVEFFRA